MSLRPEPEPDPGAPPWPLDAGAALLTVLMLVAVMSVAAVAVMDDIRSGIRRAVNVEARDQAVWYALSAEQYARANLARLHAVDADGLTLPETWAVDGLVFPIEGGRIRARVDDGGLCFNLNALAPEREDGDTASGAEAAEIYVDLLGRLGFGAGEARALAAAAADWIDADASARPAGAEDAAYALRTPPHRVANGPFAEVGELRGVLGYDRATYAAVRPYVCAHASAPALRLNINALRPRHAPVLAAALGEGVDVESARTTIETRPLGGYDSLEAFFASDLFEDFGSTETARARLALSSEVFQVDAEIEYFDAVVTARSILTIDAGGRVAVASRSYGGGA